RSHSPLLPLSAAVDALALTAFLGAGRRGEDESRQGEGDDRGRQGQQPKMRPHLAQHVFISFSRHSPVPYCRVCSLRSLTELAAWSSSARCGPGRGIPPSAAPLAAGSGPAAQEASSAPPSSAPSAPPGRTPNCSEIFRAVRRKSRRHICRRWAVMRTVGPTTDKLAVT